MRYLRPLTALTLACCASAVFCTAGRAMAEEAVATTGNGSDNAPAAEYLPGEGLTPILAKADERYAQAMARIDLQSHKRKTDEYETRLNSYQRELARVTKAGDFETAQKIKKAIDAIEDPSLARAMKPKESEKPERPKEAVKYKGHWYFVPNTQCNWHVARRKCEEMGGQLACIEDNDEARFVAQLCGRRNVWVGASDSLDDVKWLWVNGEEVDLPGASISPSIGIGGALYYSGDRRQIGTRSSNNKGHFVCEWDG